MSRKLQKKLRSTTKLPPAMEAPTIGHNGGLPLDDAKPVALADDLIIGAGPIGAFLGRPAREIYYLGMTGRLPLFKWGSKLAGRKSTLTRFIFNLEKSAMDAA